MTTKPKRVLGLTLAILGLAFLVLKAADYVMKWGEMLLRSQASGSCSSLSVSVSSDGPPMCLRHRRMY